MRLETDDGTVAWGGAASAPTMTGETVQSMAAAIRYLASKLEGMALEDIAAVMARAGNYLYGNQSAKSVIEMALHDALGRATRKPVHDLLGVKRRERIPVLRMVGTGKGTAADVEEAQRARAEGHVAFKIKVGVADPREDAERTRSDLRGARRQRRSPHLRRCQPGLDARTGGHLRPGGRRHDARFLRAAGRVERSRGHGEGRAGEPDQDRLRRGPALARGSEAPSRSGCGGRIQPEDHQARRAAGRSTTRRCCARSSA